MDAYVICCNDSIEHVVLDRETIANIKLVKLKKDFFERNKFNYKDFAEYEHLCYWHLHHVAYTKS